MSARFGPALADAPSPMARRAIVAIDAPADSTRIEPGLARWGALADVPRAHEVAAGGSLQTWVGMSKERHRNWRGPRGEDVRVGEAHRVGGEGKGNRVALSYLLFAHSRTLRGH